MAHVGPSLGLFILGFIIDKEARDSESEQKCCTTMELNRPYLFRVAEHSGSSTYLKQF